MKTVGVFYINNQTLVVVDLLAWSPYLDNYATGSTTTRFANGVRHQFYTKLLS